MWRMKVSASIQNSSTSPLRRHSARSHVALEAHVIGLGGREGGEIVRAGQHRGAAVRAASSSSGRGTHSARPRSNGLGAGRASTR